MNITRCDICIKIIKKGQDKATVYLPGFSHHDACMPCMKKYCEKFLKKVIPRGERRAASSDSVKKVGLPR